MPSKIPYTFNDLTIECTSAGFGRIKGVRGAPPHDLTLSTYRSSDIGDENAVALHEHEYTVVGVDSLGMIKRMVSEPTSMEEITSVISFGVIPTRIQSSVGSKFREIVLFVDSMDYDEHAVFPRGLTVTRGLYIPSRSTLHLTHRATYKVIHP